MSGLGLDGYHSQIQSMATRCLLVLILFASPLVAQQTGLPPVDTLPGTGLDSLSHRPPPLNYFFRSLLLPGWGQASLDRKLTGGLFIAFEGVALGMALKANTELRHLESTGSGRVQEKRDERQDWFVLLVANHLFAGLEAFVSANLYDFPGDLEAKSLGDGRTGLGLRFGLPR